MEQPTDGQDTTPEVVMLNPEDSDASTAQQQAKNLTNLVEQPAKVMRIGAMIKQLLDEVKDAPLDAASRARLAQIHDQSLRELEDGLAPELVEELHRITLPLNPDSDPSEAELRIAQAQLVGWLEGLFHGIQTALFAQQMSAKAAFEEMRRRAISSGDAEGNTNSGPQGPYL